MPSVYAHYKFGRDMIPLLPEELRTFVLKYRELYDLGLQGDAIFMKEENYKDGISHKEALMLNLGQGAIMEDKSAWLSYLLTYNSLSKRPDWDGYLTLEEANNWYRNGKGEPLYVSLQQIDLSRLNNSALVSGKKMVVNLFKAGNSLNNALVLGHITIQIFPNNIIRAFPDVYDFDMKSWSNCLFLI